jgi:hypothetical protein
MERRYGSKRPAVIASFRLLGLAPTYAAGELEQLPFGKPKHVWLSATKRLERHTFRGVPGNGITILLPGAEQDSLSALPAGCAWVWRVCKRIGSRDRKDGIEIVVTHWRATDCAQWEEAYLGVDMGSDVMTIIARTEDGQHLWQQDFRRLPTSLENYELRRIFEWQRNKFYAHLTYRETEEIALAFLGSVDPSWTLNAANRLASRLLYGYARDTGWRKLALHEQERYGVTGQWHKQAQLDLIKGEAAIRDSTGVGGYTKQAASGQVPIYGDSALVAVAEDYADRHGLPAEVRAHMPAKAFAIWLRTQGCEELAKAVEACAPF